MRDCWRQREEVQNELCELHVEWISKVQAEISLPTIEFCPRFLTMPDLTYVALFCLGIHATERIRLFQKCKISSMHCFQAIRQISFYRVLAA